MKEAIGLTPEIVRKLLAKGEGFTIEFKECRDGLNNSVYETVCSFSNRYGGHILLGVADSDKVTGVNPNMVSDMKKNFINMLNNKQKISPPLYLELEEVVMDGKILLHVYVPVGSMPETCSGKLFDRNQDADIDITTSTTLAADLYDRKRNFFSERRLFPYIKEEHLRLDELMPKVRIMARTRNAEHPWRNMSDMEIMRSADLYEENPVTGQKGFNLAAILLFGKDETIFSCCPGYVTDCILRKVNVDRYDDRLMVTSNLIDAFSQIMGFIQKHTPDPFYLEGAQSVSIRDKIAREIVSNSLGHREYSSTIPARIIIEQNRIYADNWNRSNLYGKLDPATFSPHPKNPILARFFVNIGYADILGSGVRNLYKYTPVYADGAEPELIEGDRFQTIIPMPDFSSAHLSTTRTVDKVVDKTEASGCNRNRVYRWIKQEKPSGISQCFKG
jgi:ATP-dependent DNA helicase RecG